MPSCIYQYRLLLTQYHQVPTATAFYWPSTIIWKPVPLHTDSVPPSINQYQPILLLLGDYRLLHSLPPVLFMAAFVQNLGNGKFSFLQESFYLPIFHINTENLRLVFLLMICTVGSRRWLTKSSSSGYWVKMYTVPLWIMTPSFLFFPSAPLWIMTPNFFSFYRRFHYQSCVTRAPLLYFTRSWVAYLKVVSKASVTPDLTTSPLCAIYKGINALYWPRILN